MRNNQKSRYIWVFALILGAITIGGCEKELDTYSGSDCVFFEVRKKKTLTTWTTEMFDTTSFYFTYTPMTMKDTLIRIRIAVQGKRSSVEREIAWSLSDSSNAIEGKEYELAKRLVVPADSTHTWLEVRLKRTENLKTEVKKLEILLHENEYFKLNRPWYIYPNKNKRASLIRHVLIFSDIMSNWPEGSETIMEYYFGFFSRTKIEYMCSDEVGLEIEPLFFNDKTYMTLGRMGYIKQKVQNQLNIRKAAGDPVMDGDKEMKMGK